MATEKTIFVTVSLTSVSITRAGFGTPMIIIPAESSVFTTRTKSYTSLAELAVDFAAGTVGYKAGQQMFLQTNPPTTIKIGRQETADASMTATIQAIAAEDNDWYFLGEVTRVQADQVLLATYCESEKKYFVAGEDDKATPLGVILNSTGNDQSTVYYHSTADGTTSDEFADLVMIARMSTTDPGETVWAEKDIVGVNADTLTSTEITALKAVNTNYFVEKLGLTMPYVGKSASGEWSDVIRFKDWLKARQEENLALQTITKSAANSKVPYTSAGIQMRMQVINATMQLGVDAGGLASFTTSAPLITDVSTQDKIDHVLRNVVANGVLAGAILYTYLQINLEV